MFNVDLLSGHVRPQLQSETARLKQFIGPATAAQDGLMPAADKAKLDNLGPATTTQDGLMPAADKQQLDELLSQVRALRALQRSGFVPLTFNASSGYVQGLSGVVNAVDYFYIYCTEASTASTLNVASILKQYNLRNQCDYYYFLVDNTQNEYPINCVMSAKNVWSVYPNNTVVGPKEIREISVLNTKWTTALGRVHGSLQVMTVSAPLAKDFNFDWNTVVL